MWGALHIRRQSRRTDADCLSSGQFVSMMIVLKMCFLQKCRTEWQTKENALIEIWSSSAARISTTCSKISTGTVVMVVARDWIWKRGQHRSLNQSCVECWMLDLRKYAAVSPELRESDPAHRCALSAHGVATEEQQMWSYADRCSLKSRIFANGELEMVIRPHFQTECKTSCNLLLSNTLKSLHWRCDWQDQCKVHVDSTWKYSLPSQFK